MVSSAAKKVNTYVKISDYFKMFRLYEHADEENYPNLILSAITKLLLFNIKKLQKTDISNVSLKTLSKITENSKGPAHQVHTKNTKIL